MRASGPACFSLEIWMAWSRSGSAHPDLLHAIQISKEKRTMAEMWTIAAKIEDHAPLSSLARADGWGTPFEISIRGNDYSIRSYGSDHRRDAKLLDGPHTGFWRD